MNRFIGKRAILRQRGGKRRKGVEVKRNKKMKAADKARKRA